MMRYGNIPGSSFKAITGKIIIKGSIYDALKYDFEPREVTPEMPKE